MGSRVNSILVLAGFMFRVTCLAQTAAETNSTLPVRATPATNAIESFQLKKGFRIELVAAEPLVVSPVAIAFDENGRLLKAHFRGLDIRRSGFEEFHSAQVARQIQVFYEGTLAMIIKVTDLSTTGDFSSASFEFPKHKWQRAFTDEVR